MSFTVGPELIHFCDRGTPYFELSSYCEASFADGTKRTWTSVQHYYQAMKFRDPTIQERIRSCTTPAQASELGYQLRAHVREDWRYYTLTREGSVGIQKFVYLRCKG